jgi:hypothetical protein
LLGLEPLLLGFLAIGLCRLQPLSFFLQLRDPLPLSVSDHVDKLLLFLVLVGANAKLLVLLLELADHIFNRVEPLVLGLPCCKLGFEPIAFSNRIDFSLQLLPQFFFLCDSLFGFFDVLSTLGPKDRELFGVPLQQCGIVTDAVVYTLQVRLQFVKVVFLPLLLFLWISN